MSDWIPVSEATHRYGLSRATLYRLIAEGRVKRAKRAGDARAYVSSADLKEATAFTVIEPPTRADRRRRKQTPGGR